MTAIHRLVPFRYPSGHRGTVALRYDDRTPLAVVFDFGMDVTGNDIQWTVARDVLADGFTRFSGQGDVRCWNDDTWFHLWLSGFNHRTDEPRSAVMRLDVDEVRAFLIDTEDLVAYGAESVNFDAQLARLLIGGP